MFFKIVDEKYFLILWFNRLPPDHNLHLAPAIGREKKYEKEKELDTFTILFSKSF